MLSKVRKRKEKEKKEGEGDALRRMLEESVGRGVVDVKDTRLPLAVRLALVDEFTPEDYELLLALDETVDRGLSKADLEAIPMFVPTPHTRLPHSDCLICHHPLTPTPTPLRRTPCAHVFHQSCLETWLSKYSRTCPICKTSFVGVSQGTKVVRRPRCRVHRM